MFLGLLQAGFACVATTKAVCLQEASNRSLFLSGLWVCLLLCSMHLARTAYNLQGALCPAVCMPGCLLPPAAALLALCVLFFTGMRSLRPVVTPSVA